MNNEFEDLLNPDAYPHRVTDIRCVETHISWVFLTGDYAYKIKKPLKLPFLDFSTVERRHHFCQEELRLNKRFAPQLYLGVVDVYAADEGLTFRPVGKVVDHAVKMHQFPTANQLDQMLAANRLDYQLMQASADYICTYNRKALSVSDGHYGQSQQVIDPVLANFVELSEQGVDEAELRALHAWSQQQSETLRDVFELRRKQGFIRQLHGDLHLSNMVYLDGQILAFDCLEFDSELIHIDIMSEISFLFMDLLSLDRHDLAYTFLNRFLEVSGDYSGLALLRYYTVYRALVRAKVNLLLAREKSGDNSKRAREKYERHMELARSLIKPSQPSIIIMCGMAGSGKSTLSSQLLYLLPALRLRSDLERKRLHNLSSDANSQSGVNEGIYSERSTEELYSLLLKMTQEVVGSGYTVIVDAAFLQDSARQQFRQLAKQTKIPFLILSCHADAEILRDRVLQRSQRNDDPSEADIKILEYQLSHSRLPEPNKDCGETISIDTGKLLDNDQLAATINQRLSAQRKQ